jgi:predicted lipoprotein with Yx(FWY)xxD motif
LVAVGLAAIVSASACTPSNPVDVAAPASPQPAANIQGTLVLRAKAVGSLGQVVVDGRGYTIYRYDKDTAKPPHSNCLDDCFPKWPPIIDTGDVQLDGVDQALVGSVVRDDATRQVTIAGWPAYRFSGDSVPGDARGQGVGNVWFAFTPTGKKAAGAATGSANNGAGSGGGAAPSKGSGGGSSPGSGTGN